MGNKHPQPLLFKEFSVLSTSFSRRVWGVYSQSKNLILISYFLSKIIGKVFLTPSKTTIHKISTKLIAIYPTSFWLKIKSFAAWIFSAPRIIRLSILYCQSSAMAKKPILIFGEKVFWKIAVVVTDRRKISGMAVTKA